MRINKRQLEINPFFEICSTNFLWGKGRNLELGKHCRMDCGRVLRYQGTPVNLNFLPEQQYDFKLSGKSFHNVCVSMLDLVTESDQRLHD